MIGIIKDTVQPLAKDIMAVENLNQLSDNNVNSYLFCNSIANSFPLEINTTVLQKAQVLDFNGIVLTDDLMVAQELIHLPYAIKRYIYFYDLDWKYINNFSFSHISNLLFHDNIDIIVRSKSHYNLVESLFKKPSYIMEEWDYKTLKEIDQNA